MIRHRPKSQIRGISQGDRKAVSEWFEYYSIRIYTWVIYRYRLDPLAGTEWIRSLFLSALEHLEEFDPRYETHLQWLQELAEGHPSIEALRKASGSEPDPYQWDSIEPDKLGMLAASSGRDLPEEILQLPSVMHLIRAAFCDLNETNQELLLRKYHKLNSEADLEAALNADPQSVRDALVRARHEFRRSLIQWIRKLHPEICESAPDARMEVFELNLEKILRSMDPYLRLAERTTESMIEVLVQRSRQLRRERTAGRGNSFWKWAAGGLLVLALTAGGIWYLHRQDRPTGGEDTGHSVSTGPTEEPIQPEGIANPLEEDLSEQELREQLMIAFGAGERKDVDELLRILEEESYAAQLLAAHYLGLYGDASSINPLSNAAGRWYMDPLDENPFLRAIEQIEERLSQPPEPEPAEPEPAEPVAAEPEPAVLPEMEESMDAEGIETVEPAEEPMEFEGVEGAPEPNTAMVVEPNEVGLELLVPEDPNSGSDWDGWPAETGG